MKKISILFVSALTLGAVFTSCNKDDDNSSATTSIEAKWVYAKEGVIVDDTEVLHDYVNDCSTKADYIQLKTGGTLDDVWYDNECAEDITPGSWLKNGNNIAVSMDGVNRTVEIMILNETTLKVKYTDPETMEEIVQVFTRG
ncbi:MAG TPA: hypothetical protein VLB74_10185 [Flavobacterium sp.]|uniref:hypothetical protein n=1 Tax=Flavobacterium sp. TaxID=239 RepID=UPI002D17DECA|nr:hypothetical protein [Flavobacterium sp.]HSD15005.1 hypothetical protein [Flavobacterium sp.]